MHREITLGFVSLQLIVMYMYASADEPVNGCSQLHSLEHLLEKLVRIEFKLEQLEKKHIDADESIRQCCSDVTIAFSALMTETISNFSAHQPVIIFKKVETNIGAAYKPSSGLFIAPINGTYYFHTSILTAQNSEVSICIDLNGKCKAYSNAKGPDGRHATGSQSIILELKTDDIVSVKVVYMNTIWGHEHSSFSGFLLHRF